MGKRDGKLTLALVHVCSMLIVPQSSRIHHRHSLADMPVRPGSQVLYWFVKPGRIMLTCLRIISSAHKVRSEDIMPCIPPTLVTRVMNATMALITREEQVPWTF